MRSVGNGCCAGGNKRGFFGEDFGHSAMIAAGRTPLMGDLIAPTPSLAIAFSRRGEDAAGRERIAHVANGSLHAPLLISRAHLAGRAEKTECPLRSTMRRWNWMPTAGFLSPAFRHDTRFDYALVMMGAFGTMGLSAPAEYSENSRFQMPVSRYG